LIGLGRSGMVMLVAFFEVERRVQREAKDADCNLCHHQHGRSEDDCAQCHQFECRVP
jgi:hypothetical protein